MDPRYSAQDVVCCTLCHTSVAPMYCEVCHIHLCKDCVEKHLTDSSNVHKVVSFKQYCTTLNYPKCRKHPSKLCELHCEKCNIPICAHCITGDHLGHRPIDIFKNFDNRKEDLRRDLQELEKHIHPKYKEIAANIPTQKADLIKNLQKLTTAINKQGDVWHREIDTIISYLRNKVSEMESNHLNVLNKERDEITVNISAITKSITDIKKLLDSKDVCLVSEYTSRNAEFRKLPPKLKVSLQNFRTQEINREKLIEQFGSLSELSFTKEGSYYSMPSEIVDFVQVDQSLMDAPRVITVIDTSEYKKLLSVACHNDEEVWTCGNTNVMKLYNLQKKLVKSIQTKSGNTPEDISVTISGNLVYTDHIERTLNVVKDTEIQTVTRLGEWIPRGVCSSFSGDLLVIMYSEDYKETKVVRFSGSSERQNIQFHDNGQPLFSSCGSISENRNLDICVSDWGAHAIVVVNQYGTPRFTYTGPSPTTTESFIPYGITTDSQSRILTAEFDKNRIHILDQNGQFLRYIDNCDLQGPRGLSVDTMDNIFVAESKTGKVKKIKYTS